MGHLFARQRPVRRYNCFHSYANDVQVRSSFTVHLYSALLFNPHRYLYMMFVEEGVFGDYLLLYYQFSLHAP